MLTKLFFVKSNELVIILNIQIKLKVFIISGSLEDGSNPVTYLRTSPNNYSIKKH